MMNGYRLDNFYQSKEWVRLMSVIKSERINENGELICWHCGKPIIKAYDCIGHHTIPLDENNVNNAEISLNSELIRLVHHRCHNKIHNKLGYVQKKIYLVYGSPLAGKSTWVHDSSNEGDLIIDIDSIWQCVSGCDRYIKPNRLKSVVFGMRDILIDTARMRRGKWNNAYIIGGYPLISERERLIKSLGAQEVYISSTYEECLERLEQCLDGRNKKEWKKFIDDWWEKFL